MSMAIHIYECDSGAEILFTETGDGKYPLVITIRSTTGSASLSNEDIDALAHIFRKRGPQYL